MTDPIIGHSEGVVYGPGMQEYKHMSAFDKEWCRIAAKMDKATDHEYIRKHILEYKGVPDSEPEQINFEKQRETIWRVMMGFFTLCANRILMGRFRYGQFKENRAYDCVDDMMRCLKSYEKTRNMEFLVDLSNYAWIEYRYGTHPDKHFDAIDDGEHSKQ